MGSVSRGRPRRGGRDADGMSARGWLLGALLLLTLAAASVARPSLRIAEEVESTIEPEGKPQYFIHDNHLLQLHLCVKVCCFYWGKSWENKAFGAKTKHCRAEFLVVIGRIPHRFIGH